ncbi:MAG: amino acid permease, partial [Lactobacillus gallinarum]|nr:amino acid permease [Lactobacillus gallinarum]
LYPYSNYFALFMLVLIVVFMFINPETRISVAVGAVVLIVAALAYVIKYGKKN